MLLDATKTTTLDEKLTKAHLPPMACAHPKRALVICAECETVFCKECGDPHHKFKDYGRAVCTQTR